jgi:mitochondrial fission protein ELM1
MTLPPPQPLTWPLTWIVTEGMAGTENQCVGVAEALGTPPVIKKIGLREPWKSFSPYLGLECPFTFFGDALEPPWPDLLLASGRKSIAAARYIKRKSGGKTFTVQIQDPRISPQEFDLVAVPFHDPARGENVLVTDATPNRVTREKLGLAQQNFAGLLAHLRTPRVAVLIGGTSKHHEMSGHALHKIFETLETLLGMGCSLMITASRRTGEENLAKLKKQFSGREAVFLWDGKGPNPYFGFLAFADYIFVTEDSTSMISDAGTTGKPVYILEMEGTSPRHALLLSHLGKLGITRSFIGKLEDWSYTPLADAAKIAAEIQRKSGLF